jgi:hypothetical protein
VLLNDPSFVEAARVLAENIMREGGRSFRAQLTWAFQRALARPPSREETRLLEDLFEKQRRRYQQDAEAARALVSTGDAPLAADLPLADLAGWTAVSRAVLNLHETITRN